MNPFVGNNDLIQMEFLLAKEGNMHVLDHRDMYDVICLTQANAKYHQELEE